MEDGKASGEETREFWNKVAKDWDIQVGLDGDPNRIFNSDPVLWAFAGDVRGKTVLDAGCGTGYLTRKLHDQGAIATGADHSGEMIGIARKNHPGVDFVVDSCTSLGKFPNGQFDLLISNYVLMDTHDLQGAVEAFHRVLKEGGRAVAIFCHPCFPQDFATISEGLDTATYLWNFSYYEQRKVVAPPWNHFKSEFIWFHRPLSDYWKAFTRAGFRVADFEEPRIQPELFAAAGERRVRNNLLRPYSVAFQLEKPGR